VVLAGPNGAGKSTIGPGLLRDVLEVDEFVNADVIARGLSAFDPEGVAITAGRIMLMRLRELAGRRVSFAFETTLASRSFAPWIGGLVRSGYAFHLVFLWLPTVDLAVERIADRVRLGGHGVPDDVVRRRYHAGRRNFLTRYRPLATTWRVYDNSVSPGPRLVAYGQVGATEHVEDAGVWERFLGSGSQG
jgi:predicted ABC-type ATPase